MENKDIQLSDKEHAYWKIGGAVFLIFFGVSYFFPEYFPAGSLAIFAGVLILLISFIKFINKIGFTLIELLIGLGILVEGVNTVFAMKIPFSPIFIIVFALFMLVEGLKKLKSK